MRPILPQFCRYPSLIELPSPTVTHNVAIVVPGNIPPFPSTACQPSPCSLGLEFCRTTTLTRSFYLLTPKLEIAVFTATPKFRLNLCYLTLIFRGGNRKVVNGTPQIEFYPRGVVSLQDTPSASIRVLRASSSVAFHQSPMTSSASTSG
jgi:hypothetical protein